MLLNDTFDQNNAMPYKLVSVKLSVSIILIAVMFCTGCRKKDTTVRGIDVYVAGWHNFSGGKRVAKYWKNNVEVNLTDTTTVNIAEGDAIFVEGSDVYVAGYVDKPSMQRQAAYWKNGNRVDLTDGTYQANANAITVFRGDVYVAGTETTLNGWEPRCWKNGVLQTVNSYTTNSSDYIYGLEVSGGDIYLAGFEVSGTKRYAVYWKNGQPFAIDSSDGWLAVTDIALSGSDVYLSGGADHHTPIKVGYWKNGNPAGLTIDASGVGPESIAVIGSDVYIGGYNGQVATYWKNGMPVAIGNISQGMSGGYGIFLLDNDVYTCGYQYTGAIMVAGYWKNTTWFPLPSTGVSPWGKAVFVVKQ
jgi:hypothetical protein